MKLKRTIYFFLFLLFTVGSVSCGNSAKDDQTKNSEEFKEAEGSLKNQVQDVVYNLPSPSEIPYLLQATGAEFNEQLLNPRTKVDQYVNRSDKAALNLGVYTADIGYLCSYGKTQECIDYLTTAKTLSDNLDITGGFDADVLKRFEANISNKDSLARLLDHTIKKTESFLNTDSRNKLSALVIAGSFIEGLHISTGLVQSYPRTLPADDKRNLVLNPIIRIILEQRKSVSELVKLLKSVEQTENVAGMTADLSKLEETYNALSIEEQIKNNRADLVLADKNLADITGLVDKLRKGVTQ